MSEVWSSSSNEELAAAAHAGNEAAFEVLYRRWVGPLYGIFTNPARMRADSLADAEVLVRDTLAEAWLSLRTTVPQHFPSWIAAIASRRWARYLAAKKIPLVYELDIIDPADPAVQQMFADADRQASWPAFQALLRDAIDSMPLVYRPVLRASLEKGLVGQGLADEAGIPRRQADKFRSDGRRLLYDVTAVTAMARGYDGINACPRFQRLVSRSGWTEGPLGEQLCAKLNKHLGQCPTCKAAKSRLHKTMELIPALIPVLIPASLLLSQQQDKKQDKDNRPGGEAAALPLFLQGQSAAPPAGKEKKKTGAASAGGGGAFVAFMIILLRLVLPHLHHAPGPVFQGSGQAGAQAALNVWMADSSLSVYSNPVGLTCSGTCHGTFSAGTQVTLTSTYQEGGLPLNWVGCDTPTSSAQQACTVTMRQDTAVCIAPYDPSQPDLFTAADCAARAG